MNEFAQKLTDYYYNESIVLNPTEQEELERYIVLLISALLGKTREVSEEIFNNMLSVHSI